MSRISLPKEALLPATRCTRRQFIQKFGPPSVYIISSGASVGTILDTLQSLDNSLTNTLSYEEIAILEIAKLHPNDLLIIPDGLIEEMRGILASSIVRINTASAQATGFCISKTTVGERHYIYIATVAHAFNSGGVSDKRFLLCNHHLLNAIYELSDTNHLTNPEKDQMLIRVQVNRDIYEGVRILPFCDNFPLTNNDFLLAGYPGILNKDNNPTLFAYGANPLEPRIGKILFDGDSIPFGGIASPGMSGAPLISLNKGVPRAVAILNKMSSVRSRSFANSRAVGSDPITGVQPLELSAYLTSLQK